jgi:hypothetical protein
MIRNDHLANLVVLLLGVRAIAQPIEWVSPQHGLWGDSMNWSSSQVPGIGDAVLLGHDVPYTVILQGLNNAATLTISNPFVHLDILGNSELFLAGDIVNEGIIRVNPNSSLESTRIQFAGDAALSGSGLLQIRNSDTSAYAIEMANGFTLVNDTGHTIEGNGQVRGQFVNHGSISGNTEGGTLVINDSMLTNESTAEAINGATLRLKSTEVVQASTGILQAVGGGSVLEFQDTVIRGGTVQSTGGGVITMDGSILLDGVTKNGSLDLINKRISILNTLTNNGTILLQKEGINIGERPGISCGLGSTLLGSGTIVLDNPQDSYDTLYMPPNGGLTIGADQVICGRGRIGLVFENYGTIRADYPGDRMVIRQPSFLSTNHGTIEATDGAHLDLDAMNQSSTGVIRVSGEDTIFEFDGQITGGRIESINGGKFTINDTAVLVQVENYANFEIVHNGQLLLSLRDPSNNGVIDVNPYLSPRGTSVSWGFIIGVEELTGAGVIRLWAPGDLSMIYSGFNNLCALGENQRVEGIGLISMNLLSHGTFAPGLVGQGGIGTLHSDLPLEFSDRSRLEIDIADESHDQLVSEDEIVLGGELIVAIDQDLQSEPYWVRTIIHAQPVSGQFDQVTGTVVQNEQVLRVIYKENHVVLVATCRTDFSLDGDLNFLDISAFLTAYGNQDSTADFNNDGLFNFIDISEFIASFAAGCP